jgi:RNA polymerase sigma-70 factor, ECF subfamily
MSFETDRYLIEAIKKGDHNAYEILFRSYYIVLCRYATSLVSNTNTAEDLVSDVLVRIWELPENIQLHSSLKSYLFQCVHNACINFLTRKLNHTNKLDNETIEKLNNLLPKLYFDTPEDQLCAKEMEGIIEEAIRELPPECNKIFILSRRELLSYREIANQLNISENTVKVQISRALLKIRNALKKYL